MTLIPSPDRLVESNVSVLSKFGYCPFSGKDENWSEMWAVLQSDFATQRRPRVPSYEQLTPTQQEAARIYMRRRLIADRLFEECRKAQAELYQTFNTELVERYALTRDAYEDSVEDFGRARVKLEELLPATFQVVS